MEAMAFIILEGIMTASVLQEWVDRGDIDYIDYALAERVLRDKPDADPALSLLIAYLSLAVRSGHLCVKISGEGVFPSPQSLSPTLVDCSKELLQSTQSIPSEIPLKRFGDHFYLQKYWAYETQLIEYLQALVNINPEPLNINPSLLDQYDLLPEQSEAILSSCTKGLTMLSGGPGTGKTYTAGKLICYLWEVLSSAQKSTFRIALAAPTGKAAANLQASLNRSVASIPDFPKITTQTLHALLGKKKGLLDADLILVDESSMIDARMMAKLLSVVKPGARLVLLGDPFQLPSVEAGALFSDMIQSLPEHVITLKTCLRAEIASIVSFADAIKGGDFTSILSALNDEVTPINRLSVTTSEDLFTYAEKHFPSAALDDKDPAFLLDEYNRYRILSPLRKGRWGVDALNTFFSERMQQRIPYGELFVTPIMLAQNDYRLDLFNGETGILIRKKGHIQLPLAPEDCALFPARSGEGEVRRFPALVLPRYEEAYCLSVHKSQGSEYDHVTLVMPEGAERFGREVLYTAVTRCRQRLDLWGNDDVIKATLKTSSKRLSSIPERLHA